LFVCGLFVSFSKQNVFWEMHMFSFQVRVGLEVTYMYITYTFDSKPLQSSLRLTVLTNTNYLFIWAQKHIHFLKCCILFRILRLQTEYYWETEWDLICPTAVPRQICKNLQGHGTEYWLPLCLVFLNIFITKWHTDCFVKYLNKVILKHVFLLYASEEYCIAGIHKYCIAGIHKSMVPWWLNFVWWEGPHVYWLSVWNFLWHLEFWFGFQIFS
jgi:hypothetical protein